LNVTSNRAAGLLPVALLLAAVALMGLVAVAPFIRLSALEQTIAENQESLLKLRGQITREGELRKENSDLAALGQDSSLLLEGEKTGIAGANLQRLMNALVLEHGGTASSFQILPPKEDGNLVRIPMSLSISVGIDGLRDILHSIETGSPLIFIDDIIVRSAQDDFRAPDPHYLGPLDVTLQLSGFTLQNNNGAS
jgi:general secretion pathway protein M